MICRSQIIAPILALLFAFIPVAHASPLLVGSGGTGQSSFQLNTVLLGNGTSPLATTSAGVNGKVLALVNGVPTWTSTTTFSGSAPIAAAYSGGTLTISCSTCLTGNQTITLSGAVTGSGATSIVTSFGTLSQGILGNVGSVAAVPSAISTSTLYGTGVGGQILAWAGGKLGFVATTTMPLSGIVGGTLSNTTIADNALALSMLPTQANGTVLANGSGATAVPSAISTSTLYGTGIAGQVLGWTNGKLAFVATSSSLTSALAKGNFLVGNDAGTAQATSSIYVSSTGQIGLGTVSPNSSAKMHFLTPDGTNDELWIQQTNESIVKIKAQIGQTRITFPSGNSWFDLDDAGTTVLALDQATGRVGIGTTSPPVLFQVAGPTSGTTTSEFDARSVTSKSCFNVRNTTGAATSFYFRGTTMVIEANYCR